MSDLAFIEKTKLERQFQMGGGYVLDFSNRTLAEFVVESTGQDIYDASLLIFNHVCSAVRFIRALERRAETISSTERSDETINDEIPF